MQYWVGNPALTAQMILDPTPRDPLLTPHFDTPDHPALCCLPLPCLTTTGPIYPTHHPSQPHSSILAILPPLHCAQGHATLPICDPEVLQADDGMQQQQYMALGEREDSRGGWAPIDHKALTELPAGYCFPAQIPDGAALLCPSTSNLV